MSNNLNIAILIPAAGASKRLGSPKQLLKWGDSTLIDHTIKTVKQLDTQQVLVVLGANYDTVIKEVSDADVQIVKNENWEQGLGSSIAEGAKFILNSKITIDAVLVVLVDQPLISADYLAAMIAAFKTDQESIIATSYGRDKYGVPALFDKKYLEELAVLSDDTGAKVLIKKHLSFVSCIKMMPQVLDIDTREDYDKIRDTSRQL